MFRYLSTLPTLRAPFASVINFVSWGRQGLRGVMWGRRGHVGSAAEARTPSSTHVRVNTGSQTVTFCWHHCARVEICLFPLRPAFAEHLTSHSAFHQAPPADPGREHGSAPRSPPRLPRGSSRTSLPGPACDPPTPPAPAPLLFGAADSVIPAISEASGRAKAEPDPCPAGGGEGLAGEGQAEASAERGEGIQPAADETQPAFLAGNPSDPQTAGSVANNNAADAISTRAPAAPIPTPRAGLPGPHHLRPSVCAPAGPDAPLPLPSARSAGVGEW